MERLLKQFRTVGKRRDGSVIAAFRPSYLMSQHGSAVMATTPKGPFDDSRPTTKIRLIVR
jgi:hypothetical protein